MTRLGPRLAPIWRLSGLSCPNALCDAPSTGRAPHAPGAEAMEFFAEDEGGDLGGRVFLRH